MQWKYFTSNTNVMQAESFDNAFKYSEGIPIKAERITQRWLEETWSQQMLGSDFMICHD